MVKDLDKPKGKLNTYDVVIDAGHGYKYYVDETSKNEKGKTVTKKVVKEDVGATYGNFSEKIFSRDIEEHMKEYAAPFEKYGVKFHYTSDKYDSRVFSSYKESVAVRSKFGHEVNADELVSLHFDSRGKKGYEGVAAFFQNKDGADAKIAGEVLHDLKTYGHKSVVDQHARPGNYGVLRGSGDIPATLIEFGNRNESLLRSEVWRENMARALVLSSVERAAAAGVQIPKEAIEALKKDCAANVACSLGKIEDPGQLVAENKEKAPAKEKHEKPKSDGPPLTDKQKLAVAHKVFPDLKELELAKGGHIYANGDRSATVATFISDSQLFMNPKHRDKLNHGDKVLEVPDKILADVRAESKKPEAKENKENAAPKKDIDDKELQKLAEKAFPKEKGIRAEKGNIYTDDSKGEAIASLIEGDKLYIRKEMREKLSGGKETIELNKPDKSLSALEKAVGQLQSSNVAMAGAATHPARIGTEGHAKTAHLA